MQSAAPNHFGPAFQSPSRELMLQTNIELARVPSRPWSMLPCLRSMTAGNGASRYGTRPVTLEEPFLEAQPLARWDLSGERKWARWHLVLDAVLRIDGSRSAPPGASTRPPRSGATSRAAGRLAQLRIRAEHDPADAKESNASRCRSACE
jgi:hypothetical protein